MTLNSQLIDEVVRNVMRELDLSQASPAAVPTSGLPPTSAPVELTQRVITEDVLARQTGPGGTIVIPVGAVMTPSGKDYIRRHGISVSSSSQTATSHSTGGLALVVGDIQGLSAPAASAGWTVMTAAGDFDAANQVAQECRDQPVVCCSTQPSVIACLVNRNTQRRAAVVTSRTCLTELFNDMNPDTVCLTTVGWSFSQLLRMLKQLSGQSPAVPSGWKELP
jgi:uncharacterized protein with beta-barrel porin domain